MVEAAHYPSDYQHPLRPIVRDWMRLIQEADKIKQERFGCYAKEAMQFYDAAHDFMWKSEYASGKGGFLDKNSFGSGGLPTFRMTVNRVFEAVALFGPALYHQNPNVMVTTHERAEIGPEALGVDAQIPELAQEFQMLLAQEEAERRVQHSAASVKQKYLNWLQYEADKKTHCRRAINEAIIKGMGCLWTEMYQPRGSNVRYPRSAFMSVDDLAVDPDAEYWEDVQWIARRCVHPVNLVERKYGLQPGELKGQLQSKAAQSTDVGRKEAKGQVKQGKSFDLIEYWEIYSKNGFGDQLKQPTERTQQKHDFSWLGDFCYLAVAKDIPYPLNMPSWSLSEGEEALRERASWPIPFWADGDEGWPVTRLTFYEKPKCVWPISLIKPAIGELRFVNWCMSFLADKVAASSTTYVGMMKEAGAAIKEQIEGGTSPFKIIELSNITGRKLDEVISFLQAPNFNIEIWKMVSEVLEMIDKRTGLTELIYGLSGRQMRSAREAEIRESNTSIRPDDMASRTEDWLSLAAKREMQAARWNLSGEEVLPVVGRLGAMVWDQHVLTSDVDAVTRDFVYRIEAGTARKPNKNVRVQQLHEIGQVIVPTIQQFATQGIAEPWNAYIRDVGKAMDLDVEGYLVQLPEPGEQGPSPEEIEAQMEQARLAMEQQKHEMGLTHDQESHDQEIKQSKEKHSLELKLARAKAAAAKKAKSA